VVHRGVRREDGRVIAVKKVEVRTSIAFELAHLFDFSMHN